MSEVRNKLKWADGKIIKSEMELVVLGILGPKTEADLAPPPKVEKSAKQPKAAVPIKEKEKKGKLKISISFWLFTVIMFWNI